MTGSSQTLMNNRHYCCRFLRAPPLVALATSLSSWTWSCAMSDGVENDDDVDDDDDVFGARTYSELSKRCCSGVTKQLWTGGCKSFGETCQKLETVFSRCVGSTKVASC